MVDGAKFWFSYQWLAFLSALSRWQLFQNLAPSTIVWRQCDIPIIKRVYLMWNLKRWSSPLIKALIPSPFTIFCRLICKIVLREHWRAVGYPNFQPITMEGCVVVLCILTESLETWYSGQCSAVLPINLLFNRLIFKKSDRPRFLISCCYNVDRD